ncbi:hypothetical protein GCM10010919_19310 [Alishewanella longhuensis]|uniref:N-acetyltransferase domain-containing protein n=1 Tax=Alishewanella longhuensis TaxID=1091037 RepID=A0ABQ3L3M3_9ALTE|nr:UDP-4-amino-4,6-dideoxy-N-acetyl-beta-L-altrosamine N-acetyltransferase [Alishewanella longhuensis]GHG69399.1 hypothetical protein GCM10010919_19310 [Alishewanella longhuensis]
MTASKRYPDSHFVPLTEQHLEQVWLWRNQPQIQRNMHNASAISWQQHLSWYHSRSIDGSKPFFIFLQDGRAIGVLNFQPHSAGTLEWGCYLGEDDVWPGSGLLLEIAALDYAASQRSVHTLYAEVLSFNHSVLKMHRLFGYRQLADKPGGSRDNIEYVVNTFHYPLAQWQKNRGMILSKLPKQISSAAQQIQFN